MVSKHWKRQTLSAFIFVNTVQYPRTLRNNIHHSNKQGPQSFFHTDTNPVTAHTLVHSVDKTHVLVVTVELIWLLFFQLCSSSRKISQVHKSTDKVTLLFCLMCAIQSGHVPFLAAVFLNDSAFALLSTPAVRMLLTPSWVGRRTDVKEL